MTPHESPTTAMISMNLGINRKNKDFFAVQIQWGAYYKMAPGSKFSETLLFGYCSRRIGQPRKNIKTQDVCQAAVYGFHMASVNNDNKLYIFTHCFGYSILLIF
jgi:hypothetical protein